MLDALRLTALAIEPETEDVPSADAESGTVRASDAEAEDVPAMADESVMVLSRCASVVA